MELLDALDQVLVGGAVARHLKPFRAPLYFGCEEFFSGSGRPSPGAILGAGPFQGSYSPFRVQVHFGRQPISGPVSPFRWRVPVIPLW